MKFSNVIIILILIKNVELNLEENKLYILQSKLLDGYNPNIRPVKNPDTITNISINFAVLQIISMDDQKETLTLTGYLMLVLQKEWQDEELKWNPLDYNNITEIILPIDKVWIPDLIVYNAADQNSWNQMNSIKLFLSLDSNGTCYLTPPTLITTYCELKVQDFPFDEKTCKIKFGSWIYKNSQIKLYSNHELLLNRYIDNGEWSLLKESRQIVIDEDFEGTHDTYSIMTVELYFRRKTLFYSFHFILPSLIISLSSIFGFILPPESGEKISLQITNLLTVMFYIQYVASIVPQSSMGLSKITVYLILNSALCMLSLLGNIIILDLHNRDIRIEKDMPVWLEKFVCFMGRILHFKRMKFEPIIHKINEVDKRSISPKVEFNIFKEKNKTYSRLANIDNTLTQIWDTLNERALLEVKEIKWKYAAIVLDRLFLVISIIYFIVTFIYFLISAKNLGK